MRGTGWIAPIGFALSLVACSDEPASAPDAGSAVDADAAIAEVDPPAPPAIPWYDDATGAESLAVAPPVLLPCPEGWRHVGDECDPWPESGQRRDCPLGSAHFPGEPDCAPIGAPCGADDFASGLPDDGSVIFVRAGATAGDGTRSSPLGTIAEALARAAPGTTIALAKGIYDEAVDLVDGVALVGACTAETVLAPVSSTARSALWVERANAIVSDMTIQDSPGPAFIVTGIEASLRVSGVLVLRAGDVGIVVDSAATLTLDRSVIRETRRDASGGFGRGLLAQGGSRATVSHALVELHSDAGFVGLDLGSQITVRDTAIHDTYGAATGVGRGVWALEGAEVVLERVDVARSSETGILAEDGGEITLGSSVIRDTVGPLASFATGMAVTVRQHGVVRASRASFIGNSLYAVLVEEAGEAVLDDVVVRDTRPAIDVESIGFGLMVTDAGRAVVTRARFERHVGTAIRAFGEGASIVGTDLTVSDTLPAPDGAFGRGIEAIEAASLTLRRAGVRGNRFGGIFVLGSTAELEDVIVTDTSAAPDTNAGVGITCGEGATCTSRRLLLARNGGAGIAVEGAVMTAEDVIVLDTADTASGADVSGSAVAVGPESGVEVRRLVARGNHFAGIAVWGPSSSLLLEDATVASTRARGSTRDGGLGIVAASGAILTATRVVARDNHVAGVYVEDETTHAALSDLRVVGTRSRPVNGFLGDGVMITHGATAEIDDAVLERNRETGLLVALGAHLTATDIVVRDTLARECVADGCDPAGTGVGVYSDAHARLERFTVSANALCGVQIARGGTIDLVDGEVSSNLCGANVQTEGFDLVRLMDRVRWVDNEVNLDAAVLPLPSMER